MAFIQPGAAGFGVGMVSGSFMKVLAMKSTSGAVAAEAMLLEVSEGDLQSPLGGG